MINRVDLFDVKPGRRHDLIDLVREIAPHIERLGANRVKLIYSFIPFQGIIYTVAGFDNMVAMAEMDERSASDQEFQDILQSKWAGDNSPVSGVTRSLLRDVHEFGSPPVEFSATIIRQLRVKPGRMDDMLAVSEQVGSAMEAFGGGNVLAVPALGAAVGAPNLTSSGRFPDLRSLAAFVDNVPENAMMQEVVATMTGPDAPADLILTRIVRRIPL